MYAWLYQPCLSIIKEAENIRSLGLRPLLLKLLCTMFILIILPIFTTGESPTFMSYSFWREVARSQPYWFSGVPQVHWNTSRQCHHFRHPASLLSCLSHLKMNDLQLCQGVRLWHPKLFHWEVIWMEQASIGMTIDCFPGSFKSKYDIHVLSVFRLLM